MTAGSITGRQGQCTGHRRNLIVRGSGAWKTDAN